MDTGWHAVTLVLMPLIAVCKNGRMQTDRHIQGLEVAASSVLKNFAAAHGGNKNEIKDADVLPKSFNAL